MAMSATIAVSPSTVRVNQAVSVELTVSNSGGSDVNVTGVLPNAIVTGVPVSDYSACSAALGSPQIQQSGANVVVPAGGSLVLNWGANFFAPSGSGTYSVGAIVSSSDGSVFSPTPDTVTVSQIPNSES